jgi:hypothetical protein
MPKNVISLQGRNIYLECLKAACFPRKRKEEIFGGSENYR